MVSVGMPSDRIQPCDACRAIRLLAGVRQLVRRRQLFACVLGVLADWLDGALLDSNE